MKRKPKFLSAFMALAALLLLIFVLLKPKLVGTFDEPFIKEIERAE